MTNFFPRSLIEKDCLQFCIMKNRSLGIDQKGTKDEKYPPVAMDEKNICAYTAIHREFLNIEDAYSSSQFDFSGPREYDKLTGYRTKSMLVFPLISHEEKLIGVVQLINAKNAADEIIPFSKDCCSPWVPRLRWRWPTCVLYRRSRI